MDMRAGFDGRGRKDVNYRGQGLAAAWHSCTLNFSGNFIVATAEHDTPKARSKSTSPPARPRPSSTAAYAGSLPSPIQPCIERQFKTPVRGAIVISAAASAGARS